jgi:hypothetical protein
MLHIKHKKIVKREDLKPCHVPSYLKRFKTKGQAQLAAYERELDIHWSNEAIDKIVIAKKPTKQQLWDVIFEIESHLSKWR